MKKRVKNTHLYNKINLGKNMAAPAKRTRDDFEQNPSRGALPPLKNFDSIFLNALPPELTARIFEFAIDSTAELRTCSLTCKQFREWAHGAAVWEKLSLKKQFLKIGQQSWKVSYFLNQMLSSLYPKTPHELPSAFDHPSSFNTQRDNATIQIKDTAQALELLPNGLSSALQMEIFCSLSAEQQLNAPDCFFSNEKEDLENVLNFIKACSAKLFDPVQDPLEVLERLLKNHRFVLAQGLRNNLTPPLQKLGDFLSFKYLTENAEALPSETEFATATSPDVFVNSFDDRCKNPTRLELIKIYITKNDITRAEYFFQQINNPYWQEKACVELFRYFLEHNNIERARYYLSIIFSSERYHSEGVSEGPQMIHLQNEAEKTSKSFLVIANSSDLVGKLPFRILFQMYCDGFYPFFEYTDSCPMSKKTRSWQGIILLELIKICLKNHQINLALECKTQLRSRSRKIQAREDIFQYYLQNGQPDLAIEFIKAVKDDIRVVKAYIELNDILKALEYANSLDDFVCATNLVLMPSNRENKNQYKYRAYFEIVKAYIKKEQIDAALELIEKFDDETNKQICYLEIVEFYINQNRIDQANLYIDKILNLSIVQKNIKTKDETYSKIANFFSCTGKLDLAFHYINEINEIDDDETLLNIVDKCIETNQLDLAERICNDFIKDYRKKDIAFSKLLDAYLDQKNLTKALRCIDMLNHYMLKDQGSFKIVAFYINENQINLAEQFLVKINDRQIQCQAIIEVIKYYFKNNQMALAKMWAQKMPYEHVTKLEIIKAYLQ